MVVKSWDGDVSSGDLSIWVVLRWGGEIFKQHDLDGLNNIESRRLERGGVTFLTVQYALKGQKMGYALYIKLLG